MRRPQFRGFWDRAAANIGWGFAISQAALCFVLLAFGGALAIDFGRLWSWLLFEGVPALLFLFWYVLLCMKWDRR